MIGVIGAGLVGNHVVDILTSNESSRILVNDINHSAANRVVRQFSTVNHTVTTTTTPEMFNASVVVLSCPAPHLKAARKLLDAGVSVVSCSDDLGDVLAMLNLDSLARNSQTTLVVGATMSPGMSGLLVHAASRRFTVIDEAHIAIHGTAGPSCAQQHHRALAGQAVGWHDGDWLRRPAGSGRELCWFPDPIGPRDCYRAELADPAVIHQAIPELSRVTVRMSATRRDRITARLPMLIPPHAEGGIGAVRVEVRGWRDGERHVEVIGVADRVAKIAGTVAATVTSHVVQENFPRGVCVLGDETSPNDSIMKELLAHGLHVYEFVGSANG